MIAVSPPKPCNRCVFSSSVLHAQGWLCLYHLSLHPPSWHLPSARRCWNPLSHVAREVRGLSDSQTLPSWLCCRVAEPLLSGARTPGLGSGPPVVSSTKLLAVQPHPAHSSQAYMIQQRLLTDLVAPVLVVGDQMECLLLNDSPKVKGNSQAPAPLGFAPRPSLLPDHPGNLGVSENTDHFLPSPITVCWD